jgi:hypothetical protein
MLAAVAGRNATAGPLSRKGNTEPFRHQIRSRQIRNLPHASHDCRTSQCPTAAARIRALGLHFAYMQAKYFAYHLLHAFKRFGRAELPS